MIRFSTFSPGSGRLVACVAVALTIAAVAPAPADELWDRASAIVAANESWAALEIRASAEQSNSRGQVVSRGETVVERANSRSVVETRSVVQRGENPPDADMLLETGLAGPATPGGDVPFLEVFDPAAKSQLGLRREPGHDRTETGARAAIYRFSRRRTDGTVTHGTVWIDSTTGVPLRMSMRNPSPAAPLVESETRVEFNPSPSAWYGVNLRTRATARRFMVERRVIVEVEFDQHVFLDPMAE